MNLANLLKKAFALTLSCYGVMAMAASGQFVSVTDIHFNPFAGCSASPCQLVQTLVESPVSQWQSILSTKGPQSPSLYGQDTNFPLFQSVLSALTHSAAQTKPDFVLVLGDFLAHNFQTNYVQYTGDNTQAGYQAFVDKTISFINQQLQAALPNLSIYPAIGNNDSDTGDYSVVPNGEFYAATAHLWLHSIDAYNRDSFLQTFPIGGYYAITVPGEPQNVILVLNTVMFSTKANTPAGGDLSGAITDQFAWLKTQLELAFARHQHVWIMAHIPVGIDAFSTGNGSASGLKIVSYWQDNVAQNYSETYVKLIAQYQNIIKGEFLGHEHMDVMGIINYQGAAVGYLSVTPAISPVYGNNPGYKIYQYSSGSFDLLDYQTYFLNSESPAVNGQWQMEYDFNQTYPHDNNATLGQTIIKLMTQGQIKSGSLANTYMQFYTVNNPGSQPIEQYWIPYFWCAMTSSLSSDYQTCYNNNHDE